MKACISLASWPGKRHDRAAVHLRDQVVEPLFGTLSVDHVQLVPQSFGMLDEGLLDHLMDQHPSTQFRLHANVRVTPRHPIADLSGLDLYGDWFARAAAISKRLNAPAYTAHSGKRSEASMRAMLESARRCVDLFGCPVGVEGQYPDKGDTLLVSTWSEYRQVFESGVPYAVDLSHLNILATASRCCETELVRDMLACERCIEVHVSANDGSGDWHQICTKQAWWHELLPFINDQATVFSEGNHCRQRSKQCAK